MSKFAAISDVDPVAQSSAGANVSALMIGVWIVAVLAVLFALRVGRGLLVPLIVGLLLSYVLDPVVVRLVKRGIPRGMAATLVFLSAVFALGLTVYSVRDQSRALVAKLPHAAQDFRRAIERQAGRQGPIAQVQQAADELQHATALTVTPGGQTARVEQKPFDVSGYLWASSGTAVSVAADVIVIVFLAFYLLLAGDLFRRHFVEIAGPTLSRKKITLKILDDISAQIGAYLFVRALISAIVAVATGLTLWAVGLASPATWGIVAGVLNVAPYVGAFAAAAAIGFAAFLQFHTLSMAAAVVGLTVLVACIEAYVITPWLTSRTAEMNPVAVFVGLAFWGWLWGLPGLLLAAPLMMIFKAVGERVEALRPVVTLLRASAGTSTEEPRAVL